jgi:hypothetical protein
MDVCYADRVPSGSSTRSTIRGPYPPTHLAGTADVGEREHRETCAAPPTPVTSRSKEAPCFWD